jgi:hypothetical protein
MGRKHTARRFRCFLLIPKGIMSWGLCSGGLFLLDRLHGGDLLDIFQGLRGAGRCFEARPYRSRHKIEGSNGTVPALP